MKKRVKSPDLVKEVIQQGLGYEGEITIIRPLEYEDQDLLERSDWISSPLYDTLDQAIKWCEEGLPLYEHAICATVYEVSEFNPDHHEEKWYKEV